MLSLQMTQRHRVNDTDKGRTPETRGTHAAVTERYGAVAEVNAK